EILAFLAVESWISSSALMPLFATAWHQSAARQARHAFPGSEAEADRRPRFDKAERPGPDVHLVERERDAVSERARLGLGVAVGEGTTVRSAAERDAVGRGRLVDERRGRHPR